MRVKVRLSSIYIYTVPVTEVCYSGFSHKSLCAQLRHDGVTSTYREYNICIIYGSSVVLVLSLLAQCPYLDLDSYEAGFEFYA